VAKPFKERVGFDSAVLPVWEVSHRNDERVLHEGAGRRDGDDDPCG